ncbi:MAG TPA: HEAT repeat domain-containing protein [Pirellulales bacterium]|jgi:HEAT repeat protein|nr:HEAT repeat domain-containing protein [Pirellulales bacterium]
MSQSPYPSEPDVPGDVLPPVEPPSAGFILQLFVVPGIIVVIIVMVWMLFHWVVRTGSDPHEYVLAMQRENDNSWQAAVNLANALRTPGTEGTELRQNAKMAGELAAMLASQIEAGSMKEQALELRYFLCKALGEFEIPTGLDALVKAAGTHRSDEETEVRLAALQAIAVLAENVARIHPGESLATPEVERVLLEASSDADPRVRSTAALTAGVVGGEELSARLVAMLGDSNPDVRYNAAIRLAAQGDARAADVLAEMLDPDESAGVDLEKIAELRPYKRALIVTNALAAGEQLLAKNPAADLSPVRRQLERLLASNPDKAQRVQATELLEKLAPAAR